MVFQIPSKETSSQHYFSIQTKLDDGVKQSIPHYFLVGPVGKIPKQSMKQRKTCSMWKFPPLFCVTNPKTASYLDKTMRFIIRPPSSSLLSSFHLWTSTTHSFLSFLHHRPAPSIIISYSSSTFSSSSLFFPPFFLPNSQFITNHSGHFRFCSLNPEHRLPLPKRFWGFALPSSKVCSFFLFPISITLFNFYFVSFMSFSSSWVDCRVLFYVNIWMFSYPCFSRFKFWAGNIKLILCHHLNITSLQIPFFLFFGWGWCCLGRRLMEHIWIVVGST